MRNTTTIGMAWEAFEKFFEHHNHPARIIDFEGAAAAAKPAPAAKAPKKEKEKEKDVKGKTKLGMSKSKADDFPLWYQEVITKSEMIEFYDISGCYIIRPWSFYIWECITHWFDSQIKE